MKINIIAIGNRMPAWVLQAFNDYAKRLSHDWQLKLIALHTIKRTKNCNIHKIIAEESQQLLDAVPKNNRIIALDEHGKTFSTLQLAEKLQDFQMQSTDIIILIGGPDGLSEDCLSKCSERWSLSHLTLPHGLVRVIIAEQIYRAFSILHHHPYHRT